MSAGTEAPPPPPPPPPPDEDGDGILDADDKCPTEKEDGANPDPSDGCPNKDQDGDGIEVPADKCPDKPETVNQFEDEDGCPDTKPLAQLVGMRVQINQKIMFEKGKATIQDESGKVLDAVAKVLKNNPGIQLVEVAGHASKEGNAWANRTLTQKRTEAVVKALVERGVEKDRLLPQGFGFYCPVDEGDSEEALEKNRRVEFTVVHMKGKATGEAEKRGCEAATKAGLKPKKLPKPKKWEPPKGQPEGAPSKGAGKPEGTPGKGPDTAKANPAAKK